MAKILFGVAVTNARGSVANLVFTKSRFGPGIRTAATPIDRNTPPQRAIRANAGALAKAWSGVLTQSQRDGWNALAALNSRLDVFTQLYYLTGFLLYVAANQGLAQIAVAHIDDAPALWTAGAPTALTITQNTGGAIFSVAVTTNPGATDVPVIYASPQLPAGISVAKTKLKKLVHFAAATAGPYDIQTQYVAKFGSVLSNKLIIVQVKYVDNLSGRIGIPALKNVITT